jgi:hypothetical protein
MNTNGRENEYQPQVKTDLRRLGRHAGAKRLENCEAQLRRPRKRGSAPRVSQLHIVSSITAPVLIRVNLQLARHSFSDGWFIRGWSFYSRLFASIRGLRSR